MSVKAENPQNGQKASTQEKTLRQRVADLERQVAFHRQSADDLQRVCQTLEAGNGTAPPDRAQKALLRQTAVLSRTMSMLIERDRLLQACQRIGQATLNHLDRDRILDALTEQLAEAEILDLFSVSLLERRGNALEVSSCRHSDGRQGQTGPASEAIAHAASQGGVYCTDAADGFETYYAPVRHGEEAVAMFAIKGQRATRTETLQRLAFMEPLFDQIAVALEHARLYREAQSRNRQLIRLERQRALGEMALGVSHNLNNMLAAVLVPAQFLQRGGADPEQVRREADEIVAAGRRAADLVRRLYRSVQPREHEALEAVDLDEIVPQVIEATRERWQDAPSRRGLRVVLETDLQGAQPVQGIALEVHNILANLILNAVDALPQGGLITVGTRPTPTGGLLWVRDNGIGMDEATQARVFEPFFTTKDDVGPGLGLSTVYNAVTYWGGHIDINSTPGQGSTFSVQLPAALPAANGAPTREPGPDTSGRLLIVEDDPTVRDVLSNLLAETHQVETAADGAAALQNGRAYDVALIEIGIGDDMAGDRLVRALRQRIPHLATVLVSDWPLGAGDPRAEHFDFSVHKPFHDLALLEDTVARAVELSRQRAG